MESFLDYLIVGISGIVVMLFTINVIISELKKLGN